MQKECVRAAFPPPPAKKHSFLEWGHMSEIMLSNAPERNQCSLASVTPRRIFGRRSNPTVGSGKTDEIWSRGMLYYRVRTKVRGFCIALPLHSIGLHDHHPLKACLDFVLQVLDVCCNFCVNFKFKCHITIALF